MSAALRIKPNPDREEFVNIYKRVKENDGYCPCRIKKNEDTKCMCKEFREQTEEGFCHCGLYQKVKLDSE
jgi:ferredoxin-thioredoxin reductase catalytic subunit